MGIVSGASLFVLGLVVGSFTNVLIYRLPRQIDWKWSRSFCPSCRKTLGWSDLLPLFSYALYHGRCRYCGTRISVAYPLVEASVAVLYVAAWMWIRPDRSPGLFPWIELTWLLGLLPIGVALLVIDWRHMILPDVLIGVGVGWTVVYRSLVILLTPEGDSARFVWTLGGAAGLALFFWVLILATRGAGMGFGDVKLAFLVGLVSGWPAVIASVFVAFVLGAAVGIGLILSGRKVLKASIPFGPFLFIGTGIGIVWGEQLVGLALF